MVRILMAEDDPLVASFVDSGLRAEGLSVLVVGDGEEAERLALTGSFDLMILDIGLPCREGFDVLLSLRARGVRMPVLVLTGRPQQRDVVACLAGGADDYMTKPFRLEELVARVRVRLRLAGTPEQQVLHTSRVRLDLLSRRASVDGAAVTLTTREFLLLETLLRHQDQVLSREQLLSHVWGYDFDPGTNLVNVFVSALRKKLGDGIIETVRGFGYRLNGG